MMVWDIILWLSRVCLSARRSVLPLGLVRTSGLAGPHYLEAHSWARCAFKPLVIKELDAGPRIYVVP